MAYIKKRTDGNKNVMIRYLNMFLSLICLLGLSTACSYSEVDWKSKNGNPVEILGEYYNRLVEQYKFIGNFQEGTILVKSGGKYGLLSFYGDCVLPCEYDTITSLDKSSRIVRKNGKYGVVEYNADFIAECKYDSCLVPSPKYTPAMMNGKWGMLNRAGENVIPHKYDDISQYDDTVFVAQYNGKYGIITYEDKVLIDFKCERINMQPFGNASYLEIDGKIAVANSHYKQVTEPLFGAAIIDYFDKDGCASLRMVSTSKCGLVDVETGKTLIPFEYDDMGFYSEGLVRVCKNDKWGYCDNKGNVIIPLKYNDAKDFSEGLAFVGDFYANKICKGGLMTENHYGFIDKKGDVVIPIKFADQSLCGNDGFHCGLAAIGEHRSDNIFAGKIGYIDKTGTFVISPQFDSADSFFLGLAVVEKNNRTGVIDTKGETIIPYNYKRGWISENDSTINLDFNTVYKIIGVGKIEKQSE